MATSRGVKSHTDLSRHFCKTVNESATFGFLFSWKLREWVYGSKCLATTAYFFHSYNENWTICQLILLRCCEPSSRKGITKQKTSRNPPHPWTAQLMRTPWLWRARMSADLDQIIRVIFSLLNNHSLPNSVWPNGLWLSVKSSGLY